MATLGERLRYALAEFAPGLGYNELDWLLRQGDTGGYVTRLLSDEKKRPDPMILVRLCQILGIDIAWLLAGALPIQRDWGHDAIPWQDLVSLRRERQAERLRHRRTSPRPADLGPFSVDDAWQLLQRRRAQLVTPLPSSAARPSSSSRIPAAPKKGHNPT